MAEVCVIELWVHATYLENLENGPYYSADISVFSFPVLILLFRKLPILLT